MAFTNCIDSRSARNGIDRSRVRQMPLPVLAIGRDREMLQLLDRNIRSCSDLAIRSLSPEEAEPLSQRPEPHLWLFCNTFEARTLIHLACRVIRYSPQSRLLLLSGAQRVGLEGTLFHHVVRRGDGYPPLLEAVSELSVAA